MKKLLVLGLLMFSAYKLYQYVVNGYGNDNSSPEIVQLFVGPDCKNLCTDVEAILNSRNVNYELIDVSTPEGQKYGIHQYPVTQIGKNKILGNGRAQVVSALINAYGDAVLTPAERTAMRGHFDENGNPVVVLYGTQWCGHCKRQREYFASNDIEYYDVDAETSSIGKFAYETLQGGGYPLTYVGYKRFDGYKEREILSAIAALK
jgi:glutaredoxin